MNYTIEPVASPNNEMATDEGAVGVGCKHILFFVFGTFAWISKFVFEPFLCYITLVPLLAKQPTYHFIPVCYEFIQYASVIAFLELCFNTVNELGVQIEHSFTEFFQLLPLLSLVLVALI